MALGIVTRFREERLEINQKSCSVRRMIFDIKGSLDELGWDLEQAGLDKKIRIAEHILDVEATGFRIITGLQRKDVDAFDRYFTPIDLALKAYLGKNGKEEGLTTSSNQF